MLPAVSRTAAVIQHSNACMPFDRTPPARAFLAGRSMRGGSERRVYSGLTEGGRDHSSEEGLVSESDSAAKLKESPNPEKFTEETDSASQGQLQGDSSVRSPPLSMAILPLPPRLPLNGEAHTPVSAGTGKGAVIAQAWPMPLQPPRLPPKIRTGPPISAEAARRVAFACATPDLFFVRGVSFDQRQGLLDGIEAGVPPPPLDS